MTLNHEILFFTCFYLSLAFANYSVILQPYYMGLFLWSWAISSRRFQLLNKVLFYVGSGRVLLCSLHFMLFLMRVKLTGVSKAYLLFFLDLQKLKTPLENLISACFLHLRRSTGLCWPTIVPSFAIYCSPTS